MRYIFTLSTAILLAACSKKIVTERTSWFPKQTQIVNDVPDKQNVWVFILAGQSNMAGRGMVEPKDTIPVKRILSIDKNGRLIIAKEPLHWYEPALTGLDCGYSFGKTIIKGLPPGISVLIIPTAVGGSSISQWLGDSIHRNVKLYSNFLDKVKIAQRYGIVKAILWHQGESDASEKNIPLYKERLGQLFKRFRSAAGNDDLPVLIGELGSFSKNPESFKLINSTIHAYSLQDRNTAVISTPDLKHKGDSLHFNSKSQRIMGKRFAEMYLKNFN